MNNKIILNNYLISLEQKYNAVCFDIDGTLTENNSSKIDERAIEMIADLLKKKIPIVFITGRGSTGLNRLIKEIHYKLLNNYNVKENELNRMYALTNDGARLFYSLSQETLNDFTYICTENELNQLKKFNEKLFETKNEELNNLCNITYSKDEINNKILNVRFVMKNNEETFN